MPIFKYNISKPPPDSEVKIIEVIHLMSDEVKIIENHSKKEKFLIAKGNVLITANTNVSNLSKGDVEEYDAEKNRIKQIAAYDDSIIIRVGGNWERVTGSSGIFELAVSSIPENIGDPTEYERNTNFDNHYHDCDEYWIIYEGKGEIVTEGKRYTVMSGDCVFTKAGDHHDFPIVYETIKGAWFETTLIGGKRKGHLWDHTHSNNKMVN